jgi:transposase-like protein
MKNLSAMQTVDQVAYDLGISRNMLFRWRKERSTAVMGLCSRRIVGHSIQKYLSRDLVTTKETCYLFFITRLVSLASPQER